MPTRAVPKFSFDNSVPAPELLQTGTDYKRILRSLFEYHDWANAHRPDAKAIDKIAAHASPVATRWLADVAKFRDFNARMYVVSPRSTQVTLVSSSAERFRARVLRTGEQRVVDRKGKLIFKQPLNINATFVAVMSDGAWRVQDSIASPLAPRPGYSDGGPPPPLVQTGKDYNAILESLLAYGDWTRAHSPDPQLATVFTAAGSEARSQYETELSALHLSGKRVTASGPRQITIVDTSHSGLFTARVTDRSTGRTLIYVVVQTGGGLYKIMSGSS